ncbi:MAG: GNAT family N-acetyltransferase, partial [Acidobacteriota bacterium]|nr:GNAT family N-acetyltransferase [Acidobacteriota bacterium]
MRAGVVSTIDGMSRLREKWPQSSAGNLFSEFEYLYAWAQGLPEEQRLHLIVPEGVRAVVPLVECDSLLSFLAAEMFEMQDLPLAHDAGPDAARAVASALIQLRMPLHLHRVSADSPVLAALKEMSRARGILRVKPVDGSPVIRLSPQWRDPETRLNSGRRSDLRRMRKKAFESGEVFMEEIVAHPGNVNECLDRLFTVEAAGWKGASGSALRCDAVRSNFFRRFCMSACMRLPVRFFFMRIGESDAAAQLTVERSGRLWLLRAGYDERFGRCSPGTLLTV